MLRFFVALAFFVFPAISMASPHLKCEFLPVKTVFRAGEPVIFRFSLRNPEADKGIYILDWNLPLEDRPTDNNLDVFRNGIPVEFKGKHINRGNPSADQYVFFAPGESKFATIDLGKIFDLSEYGDYLVVPHFIAQDFIEEGDGKPPHTKDAFEYLRLECDQTGFKVVGDPAPSRDIKSPSELPLSGRPPSSLAAGPFLVGCNTVPQVGAIRSAYTAATANAAIAYDWTDKLLAGSLSNTWFGKFSSQTAKDSVAAVIEHVAAHFKSQTTTINCSPPPNDCEEDTLAYVQDGQNDTIWLCPAFFEADASDQIDTIYHEVTHFFGTEDDAYGESNCRKLAERNPTQAQNNADSFSYFAGQAAGWIPDNWYPEGWWKGTAPACSGDCDPHGGPFPTIAYCVSAHGSCAYTSAMKPPGSGHYCSSGRKAFCMPQPYVTGGPTLSGNPSGGPPPPGLQDIIDKGQWYGTAPACAADCPSGQFALCRTSAYDRFSTCAYNEQLPLAWFPSFDHDCDAGGRKAFCVPVTALYPDQKLPSTPTIP